MERKRRILAIIFSVMICCLAAAGMEGIVMAETRPIQLPRPVTKGEISLEETIAKRRSKRFFKRKNLSQEQISQLLWAAQGITEKRGDLGLRAAPSAGALYPTEIYLLTKDGFFHYLPEKHALEIKQKRDLRSALASAALGQSFVRTAAADIVIAAVYSRMTSRYGHRGIRYTDMEAGHIAENIHLQAVALGLGSIPVGAFDEGETKKALSLPANEEVIYIIPVGYAEETTR